MKKVIKTTLIILLIALIVIQFIRPAENKNEEIASENITANFPIPDSLHKTLKVSCYDCHSNTTVYPFYFKIQPVAWFLDNHIQDGKRHFNFSTFSSYPVWRQYDKFKDIVEQIKKDEMPLTSYTLIHRDAILSADQKIAIIDWSNAQMKEMEAKYPADSLARPKRN